MRDWPGPRKCYDSNHKQLCPCDEYEPYESLEQRFAKHKHPDIGDEEAAAICELIRKTVAYNSAERPSAEELFKHPWFSE